MSSVARRTWFSVWQSKCFGPVEASPGGHFVLGVPDPDLEPVVEHLEQHLARHSQGVAETHRHDNSENTSPSQQ